MSDPVEKRDFSQEEREDMASKYKAMPDGSFPIASAEDMRNAIQAVGRAKDYGAAKAHIISRAKAMGMTNMLPDDWVQKEKDDMFSCQMDIVKAIPMRKIDRRGREYRLIKSMVMSPRKIDKQLDWTDEDEIQDAVHEFMIGLQKSEKPKDESGISYRHKRLVKSNDAKIVENGQIDFPETWGVKTYPAGTWKVAFRVYDPGLFPEIDAGELRGCSVEGTAVHTATPLT